jgi:hypothetical protein
MNRPYLALIAACLSAACTRTNEAADTTRTATAGGSVAQTPAPAAPLAVTPMGIGPVRAGMTIAELRQALDSVRFTDPDSARCAYPKFAGLPEGVWVMVEQGIVGRVDVQKGDVATAEGIRIGDDSADVRAAYGKRMTVLPHKYTDGKYLEVKSASDTMHLIIFETNVEGTVLRYRAGQLPQVRYVESCS